MEYRENLVFVIHVLYVIEFENVFKPNLLVPSLVFGIDSCSIYTG